MEGSSLLIFGAFALLGPLIGALIGRTKGRGLAGFFLGLLGGFVGWIIIGLLPRKPEKEAEYQAKVDAARFGPPATGSRGSPCWAPDPFGRHGLRFFDGQWTDKVIDSGSETSDSPVFVAPDGLVDDSGWAPDPFDRFQTRFFHDGRWTSHVSTGDSMAEDPPRFPPPMESFTPR